MFIDFLASTTFYLVPFLTGRFFRKSIIEAWALGALIWFILFFAAGVLSKLQLGNFSTTIFVSALIVSLISLSKLAFSWFSIRPRVRINQALLPTILIIFSSLVYFFIWKKYTPYPLQLNWDIYEHITLANLISEGEISFLTSKISDTFTVNSYSPMFQILLSIPKILFQKSLLGIYWWLEYWHYLLTVIASFLIAKKIFNNAFIASLSALVSSLVFESVVVYSGFFLIPQTLASLLTIFVFKDLREINPKFLAIVSLVIFLLHYVVGLFFVLILFFGFFVYRYKPPLKLLNTATLLSVLGFFLLIFLHYLGSWQVVKTEEAVHFTFPLFEKFGFFLDWYSLTLIGFFIAGFISLYKKNDLDKRLVLFIGILLLGISLAPFSYFLKFYALGRYFVTLIMAFGIAIVLAKLPKIPKILSFSLIIVFLVIVFYKNQLIYKEPLHFSNLETQVSPKEIEAGEWLIENKKTHSFLISDPSTQYILEAVSGINTQGGVYMNSKTRENLMSINNSYDPNLIREKLLEIHDDVSKKTPKRETLFVIGGRYFAWQKLPSKEKENSFYNIWSPKEMTDENKSYVDFLKNSSSFRLIYMNSELAVFRII